MTARVVAILALLAAARSARAGEWLERSHIEWRPGLASPGGHFEGFDRDLTFTLSAGVRLHPNVGVEVSASWLEFATPPMEVQYEPRPDVPYAQVVFTERLAPVMLDVKWLLPLGRWELYALAGTGVCFSAADTSVTASASDAAFAWEAAAGFALQLDERVAVTADVRRLSSSGTYRAAVPLVVSWPYQHHPLEVLVAGAGLAFRL